MNKFLKILFDVIFVIIIVLLSLYFVLRLMGTMEIYKVQTGSMEDGIHAGDYILVYKKDKYNVGDVVTYKKEGYHVTHRIIKKNGSKIITKGDANNTPDEEINVKSVVGMVIYNGGLLNFVINYKFAIASVLLTIYLFSYYLSTRKYEKELLAEASSLEKDDNKKYLEDLLDLNNQKDKEKSDNEDDKNEKKSVKKSSKKKKSVKKTDGSKKKVK